MSPETLLNLCREAYLHDGLTLEQFEQNVGDVFAGRRLSAGPPYLRALISTALYVQLRYVTPEHVAEIVEVSA